MGRESFALPLKILELLSTPPKNTKNGLFPLKNREYGQYPPLKSRDPPPLRMFLTPSLSPDGGKFRSVDLVWYIGSGKLNNPRTNFAFQLIKI